MTYDLAQPTIRGDVALLNQGRRGMDEDSLAVCSAVLLDAALAGVVEVTGKRVLGIDRRRVVAGPAGAADPLIADLRRRVEIASPGSPGDWFERIGVFGEDAVAEELVAAGVARRVEVPWWRRWLRHRSLEVTDPSAVAAALARLKAVGDGRSLSPHAIGLGFVLRETDLLGDMLGRRDARHVSKRLDDGVLPPAGRAIVATLREWRRRADSIGTYYADD
ncbi:MAG TPA: GPP34 family phosphoprotein [Solirubrobacteraceae bacterium]